MQGIPDLRRIWGEKRSVCVFMPPQRIKFAIGRHSDGGAVARFNRFKSRSLGSSNFPGLFYTQLFYTVPRYRGTLYHR
eukprot:SAG11_NODE_247_length_11679_cov_6.170898_10_plen_78_part_00